MKWVLIVIIVALWTGYGAGHDTKPVPRWFHAVAQAGYAALIGAVIAWL